ncbi:MAG: pentapeptide repeat-containing protein [Polyangiaceae bacterium]
MTSPEWPVAVEPVGGPSGPTVSAATVLFRHRGVLRVAVVAKATFDIVPERPITLRAPDEIVPKDRHLEHNAGRSVREASDLAPYKPRVDLTLVGHAVAPASGPVPSMSVRLALAGGAASAQKTRGGTSTIDRVLHVRGDRDQPFAKLPLVAERALLTKENPVGTRSPNIVDAASAERAGICGPIARSWPSRKSLLVAPPARPSEAASESASGEPSSARRAKPAPPADYADAFDWRYFLAAPAEQQVDTARGDEWLLLEGVHPEHARIRTQLPSARARARVAVPDAPATAQIIDLVLDTIAIDADRMTIALVFRQSFPLVDESLADRLRVQVGLALGEQAIDWQASTPASSPRPSVEQAPASVPSRGSLVGPDSASSAEPRSSPGARAAKSADLGSKLFAEQTTDLSSHAELLQAELGRGVLPFGRAQRESAPLPPVTAKLGPGDASALRASAALPFAAARTPEAASSGQTRQLSPDEARLLREQASLPFASTAPSAASRAAGGTSQLDSSEVEALREALPFARASAAMPRANVEPAQGAPAPPPRMPAQPPMMPAQPPMMPAQPPMMPAQPPMRMAAQPPMMPAQPPMMLGSSPSSTGRPGLVGMIAGAPPPSTPGFAPVTASPPAPAEPPPPAEPDLEAPPGSPRHRVIELLAGGGSLNMLEAVGAPLSKLDFSGRSLQNARLDGANLRAANLVGCDLSGAHLHDADLTRAKLDRANLTAAELKGARVEGASFAGARLDGATFEGASGDGAIFKSAKGEDASFTRCTLAKASFEGASLARADFKRATLEEASFTRAELEAASFEQATLGKARFDEAKMKGSALSKAKGTAVSFAGADLTEAEIKRAELADASFANATLESANFERSDLSGVDLRGAKTEGADFGKAKLEGAKRDDPKAK